MPGWFIFEVPRENADALAEALRGLESAGLRLVVARSEGAELPGGLRGVALELIGEDRLGIVAKLTRILAEAGVSIEHMHTEIVGGQAPGKNTFKVTAQLLVPRAMSSEELRVRLEALGREMMVDFALGDRPGSSLDPSGSKAAAVRNSPA